MPDDTASALTARKRTYAAGAITCTEEEELAPAKLSALTRLRVGPGTPDIGQRLLRPFFSDGCSASPDDGWQHCCVEHDTKYWLGGTEADKRAADDQLAACITQTGHPAAGRIYEAAVQRFGGPDSWMVFRWGYGWNQNVGFEPPSADGEKQERAMYGASGKALLQKLATADYELERVCVANDPGLNAITDQDRAAYALLREKLRTTDTVVWAKTRYFDRREERFEVQLARCPGPLVVTFARYTSQVTGFENPCP